MYYIGIDMYPLVTDLTIMITKKHIISLKGTHMLEMFGNTSGT